MVMTREEAEQILRDAGFAPWSRRAAAIGCLQVLDGREDMRGWHMNVERDGEWFALGELRNVGMTTLHALLTAGLIETRSRRDTANNHALKHAWFRRRRTEGQNDWWGEYCNILQIA